MVVLLCFSLTRYATALQQHSHTPVCRAAGRGGRVRARRVLKFGAGAAYGLRYYGSS